MLYRRVMCVVAVLMIGCNRQPTPPSRPTAVPVEKIQLGMSLDEAIERAGRGGDERAYEQLPTAPKPRDAYPNLPPETKWRVWSDPGAPVLIVGVLDNTVIFKQVVRGDGDQIVVEAEADQKYQ